MCLCKSRASLGVFSLGLSGSTALSPGFYYSKIILDYYATKSTFAKADIPVGA